MFILPGCKLYFVVIIFGSGLIFVGITYPWISIF